MRPRLRLGVAAFALAQLCACGGDEAPSDRAEPGLGPALAALDSHLEGGGVYSEGADAALLGRMLGEEAAEGDAIAIRVIPGDPRTVVMLSRYQADPDNESLAQLGHEGRVAEVRALEDFIDEQYGARDANLAIALRDARGYRTVGVRPVDREIDVQDGDDLDLAPLERLLAARPGVDPLPPPIEPDGVVSGMIVGPPRAPVAYRLTLGAPARVLTELSVPSALDDPPMLAICRGVVRPARCVVESLDAMELDDELDLHDELSPGPVRDEVMRSAYGLPAGIYTVAIDSPCDPGDPCPADGAAFTLRLRTLRRED